MGKGNGDLDTRISRVDNIPELLERRPGVLKQLYEKSGYLYKLDGTSFHHYDYLWSLEVISFEEEIKPISKILIPNIFDTLIEEEKKGNIIIYRYPHRPKDVPLDNSDLVEKYLWFQRNGNTHALESLLRVYPEFAYYIEAHMKENESTQ